MSVREPYPTPEPSSIRSYRRCLLVRLARAAGVFEADDQVAEGRPDPRLLALEQRGRSRVVVEWLVAAGRRLRATDVRGEKPGVRRRLASHDARRRRHGPRIAHRDSSGRWRGRFESAYRVAVRPRPR